MTKVSSSINEFDHFHYHIANPKILPELPRSIYFGGCAFGSSYYVGVHRAFTEMYGPDYYKQVFIAGGSAGTVMAVGIALGKSPEYLHNLYCSISKNAQIPVYYASKYLEEQVILMINEDPLSYKKLTGRCCFGTTSFFAHHRWHISWNSNEDLIECIIASYHIPFYCKYVRKLHGEIVLDGAYGFSGVDLVHEDDTLFVGIDPHAEITRELTNSEMFFPNVGLTYLNIVKSGYEHAKKWNGVLYKKVGYRQPNYAALLILWSLRYVEYFLFETLELLLALFTIFIKL